MKKLMILLLTLAFLLTGCGSSGVSPEEYDKVVAERNEYKEKAEIFGNWYESAIATLKENAEETKGKIEEDYQSCINYINSSTNIENQEEIISYVQEIYSFYHDNIDYYVTDYIEMEEKYYSDNTEQNKKIDTIISASQSIYSSYTIFFTRVRDILPEYDNKYKGYSGTVENKKLDSESKETLVFEDDKVKIYFAGIGERGIEFWVENLTDANITIQADSVSINGISTNNIMMSDNVAPQSKGKIVAKCNDFSVETKAENISGQLTIIDFEKSFESYKATFANIPIE